ncbi:MAG TPA: CsgG/HfaB family protein [Tepidisphaeraceae bacterium]|nr:CsgG/HfaB family protein [Tepidisphaeraceae bacterium]
MKFAFPRNCVVALMLAVFGSISMAQDAPTIKQVGIGEVTPTKSLHDRMAATGQNDSINHLVDSLNEHLLVSFQGTNKFKIIVKQDLAKVLEDQGIPTGIVRDPSDRKSLPGKIKGLDYLVLCAVTDFKDLKQSINVQSTGITASLRQVQATMIIKIYDTTTGELISAVDVPVRQDEKGTVRNVQSGMTNGAPDDSLIEGVVKELAERSALRVVDVIYPPKVAQIANGTVYINRGEGSGVLRDQIWTVFAAGPEIRDPDTGKVLGKEEVEVGEVRISDVMGTMSKAVVQGDNRGIAAGAIVRLKSDPTPPGSLPR